MNALHPRQEFESPEDRHGFHKKRVRLFRDLEKAVRQVIDADDHPVDFFRRRDGLPARKSTSILASPEDRPVERNRREDELPAAKTTSTLASPEDRDGSHNERVRLSMDLENAVLRIVNDDDHPVDFSRREDGPQAPKTSSISASPEDHYGSHNKRVQMLRGFKRFRIRAMDADGHPIVLRGRDELSASKPTSILAPTNGAAPSSEDSPSQEDAPSSEETPNPVTRSYEAKDN